MRGNGDGVIAISSPQPIAAAPQLRRRFRRHGGDSTLARPATAKTSKPAFSAQALSSNQRPAPKSRSTAMKTDRTEANAELHESFEPLRTTFAVLALLLGLVAAMHF
jgi:hypothetical protein